MRKLVTMLLVLALPLVLAAATMAAELRTATESGKDTTAACMDMMQGQGFTDEGRKAMGDFMQSDRAPQAMARMMEMARRMGDGDVMLGMTRMMEMMGGGMMGGQGMMSPGREPRK